jgi:hypothetical protein
MPYLKPAKQGVKRVLNRQLLRCQIQDSNQQPWFSMGRWLQLRYWVRGRPLRQKESFFQVRFEISFDMNKHVDD